MKNDQVSGTPINRKGHRLVRRFAAAAAISVGVLGVSNIQSASAATDCPPSFVEVCGARTDPDFLRVQQAQADALLAAILHPQTTWSVTWPTFNTANQAAMYAMQQNDMLQAQTIFAPVSAQQSAQAVQNWQTMQASQTSIFAYTQDVTVTAALRANTTWSLMDAYIR